MASDVDHDAIRERLANAGDYFAAHAPAEIPDWFEFRQRELKPPVAPWSQPGRSDDDLELLRLVRDDLLLLDDLRADLREQVLLWREDQAAFVQARNAQAAIRFFKWRWFYAAMMIHTCSSEAEAAKWVHNGRA